MGIVKHKNPMALMLSGIGAISLFLLPAPATAQEPDTLALQAADAPEAVADTVPTFRFLEELTAEPADTLAGRVNLVQSEAVRGLIGQPGQTTPGNIVVIDGVPCVLMTGYRIQAFAGNSQATAKQDAFQREIQLKSYMPGLPTYVRYSAPFWRLRVGDYLTYEEAYEVLLRFQRAFDYGREMSIVREKINVPAEKFLK